MMATAISKAPRDTILRSITKPTMTTMKHIPNSSSRISSSSNNKARVTTTKGKQLFDNRKARSTLTSF